MQKKSFSFKDFIPYKFIYQVTFLIFVVGLVYTAQDLYNKDVKNYQDKTYMDLSNDINGKIETLLKNKLDRIYLIGLSIAHSQNVKESLLEDNPNSLKIDSLIKQLKMKKNLSECCLLIRDQNGNRFKAEGDFSSTLNTTVNTTGFHTSDIGFSFYNIYIVDYYNEKIGSVVIKSNLDDFIEVINKHGFETVVLLNQEDSKKINLDKSRTKKFIENYYVANSNSDPYLLKLIGQHGVNNFFKEWTTPYNANISSEYLIIKYPITNGDKKIANLLLFKKYSTIDTPFEDTILYQYIAYIAALIMLLSNVIYFMMTKDVMKKLDRDNKILNLENDSLKEKSDQLDYNEKKLENLFNMQPNLMIMHNGHEVTSANKRFMGFFNRFGDFEGFKIHHRCVSELFEKFDAPNYIWEQYIEGEFWIDYLLNNPRRLYKTVMSIDGNPHHFIIKFNELTYAKYVSERLIIIALVDMTQDLPNYKSLEELNQKGEVEE